MSIFSFCFSTWRTREPPQRHFRYLSRIPAVYQASLILGHQRAASGFSQGAMRDYLRAFQLQPNNPFVCLCAGKLTLLQKNYNFSTGEFPNPGLNSTLKCFSLDFLVNFIFHVSSVLGFSSFSYVFLIFVQFQVGLFILYPPPAFISPSLFC